MIFILFTLMAITATGLAVGESTQSKMQGCDEKDFCIQLCHHLLIGDGNPFPFFNCLTKCESSMKSECL